MGKIEITTTSGFKCKMDEDTTNDMEFFEMCKAADRAENEAEKTYIVSDMLDYLLGDDIKKALYAHIKKAEKTSRVHVDSVMTEFVDIMNQLKDAKK